MVSLYMSDYQNEPEDIEELMLWPDMIQQRCRIEELEFFTSTIAIILSDGSF